jgi:hypothetical protein
LASSGSRELGPPGLGSRRKGKPRSAEPVGPPFGRSAYRSIAITVLFFGPLAMLFGAGGVLTELAAPSDAVYRLGNWFTAAGIVGGVTCLIFAVSAFLIGRPHWLLPSGLRGQPGFLWDRGRPRHRARLTEVDPSDGPTYYLADCECGWMDAPHDTAPRRSKPPGSIRRTSAASSSVRPNCRRLRAYGT